MFSTKFKQLALGAAITALTATSSFAADVTVSVTAPKGSAGNAVDKKILKNIVYSPCVAQPVAISTASTNLANATAAAAAAVTAAATAVTDAANSDSTAVASAALADSATAGDLTTQAHIDLWDSIDGTPDSAAAPTIAPGTLDADDINDLNLAAGEDAADAVAANAAIATADALVTSTAAEVVSAQAVYDAAVSEIINLSGESISNPFDQLKVNLKVTNDGDANGNYVYDLYFMLSHLTTLDADDASIFIFERVDNNGTFTPLNVVAYETAALVDASVDGLVFLPYDQFTEASYEEDILGNKIYLDTYGLKQGTWMATAILANSTTFKLEDPRTWAAWDANVFVLGSPFATASGTTGTGVCL